MPITTLANSYSQVRAIKNFQKQKCFTLLSGCYNKYRDHEPEKLTEMRASIDGSKCKRLPFSFTLYSKSVIPGHMKIRLRERLVRLFKLLG